MTTAPTIRTKVRRWGHVGTPDAWTVCTWILDTDTETGLPIARKHKFADAPSWPEAMQAAQVLRAQLEQQLMDEVHASRASRRTERTAQLEAEQPPARAVPQPARAVAFCPCTQCTEIRDQHTELMEPTA